MNTFDLSRNFTNWAFDNPEKVHPNHYAIYFFAIEHCNRLGGKEKFGFPSQMTMEAIGIRKHQTYIKYFNDLIEFGFFKLIEKSKNQYSANIISLVYAMPKKGKALDKANIKHRAKQTESTGQSTGQSSDNIDKQVNKETINKDEQVKDFIKWFNDKKLELLNKKGKFSKLSKTDITNLLNINENYSFEDLNYSIIQMSRNKWVLENNYFTPSHFLRIDNFNKYLNSDTPELKSNSDDNFVKYLNGEIEKPNIRMGL